MKEKINYFLVNVWDEITYGLKCLCGEPTPMKRFVFVSVIGGALSIGYIYMLAGSIYNIGKNDTEKEFMKLRHIEVLKLQPKQDSVNYETTFGESQLRIKNYGYEYE